MSETIPYSNPTTSKAAADSIKPVLTDLEARVLSRVVSGGTHGVTCDEAEIALGLPHQTVSARINGLRAKHVIVDSGRTRKTRSNRSATVWVSAAVSLMFPKSTEHVDERQARETKTSLMTRYMELVGLLVPVFDIVRAAEAGGSLVDAQISVSVTQGVHTQVIPLKTSEIKAIMDHMNLPMGK